jgi:uncharacterized membrane protein (UPF0127 family)
VGQDGAVSDTGGASDDDDEEDGSARPARPAGALDGIILWGSRLLLAAGAVVVLAALVLMVTDDEDGGGGGGDDEPTNTFGTMTPDATTEPSDPSGAPSTEDGAVASLPEVDGPFAAGRTQIPGFGEVEVHVIDGPDGEPIVLCVLLAETPDQRRQGLMRVEDPSLGGYDGMLFTFDEDQDGGFWMRDTPLPLSIAYLDDDGAAVDAQDMEPCLSEGPDCPSYPSSDRFRQALEVPEGGLERLGLHAGSDARLEVAGACRDA